MGWDDIFNFSVGDLSSTSEDQLFFAYNKDYDLEESFISRPFSNINLPEVVNLNLSFVYNYYTSDERTYLSEEGFTLDPDSDANSAYNAYQANVNSTPVPPRYVKISFQKPTIDSEDVIIGFQGQISNDNETLDKVNLEGTLRNKIGIGFDLYDTGKESKIYSMLKMNSLFRNINSESLTQREIADRLHDTLSEKGGLKGEDKKLLYEVFANVQEEGYEFAKEDAKRETVTFSKDSLTNQKFAVKLHVGHISDILNASNALTDNVFSDELKSVESDADDLRTAVLNNVNYYAGNYDELDFVFDLNIWETIPTGNQNVSEGFDSLTFAGYYIEKYEIQNNGSSKLVGKLLVQNINLSHLKDKNVNYGKVYRYIVRTLFVLDVIEESGFNLYKNRFLLASKGEIRTVNCVEKEYPDPPEGLRFKFDYKLLKPHIHWQFPLNKQRDIKKFQVFKRYSIKEPFQVIAEIDFDKSKIKTRYNEKILRQNYYPVDAPVLSFLDTSHVEGEAPIYAIGCVDAHGNSSNYSAQYQIYRDKLTNIVKRNLISKKNAPKSFPNFYINVDSFQDLIKSSGNDRIKIFFEPEYYRVDKNEVEGDNTSAQKDLKLLAIDPNNPRYVFHFINIDNNKDAKLFIKIKDESNFSGVDQDYFEAKNQKVAGFNPQSFSFK